MPKDQPVEFEVSKREVVFYGRIWDVVRETFDYNDEPLVREFVSHTGAVAILALNGHRELLMIRQYRHPVRSYLWEIPAGLLDVPGESMLLAAKRELFEETGYIARDWSELTSFHTTPGGNNETITIFLAEGIKHQGHEFELEGEEQDMKLEWVPLKQALRSVLTAEIKNPSAVVGIMALAHRLGVSVRV